MALRITCPGCKTALKFDDDMRGQKVRCTECDKRLTIPAATANGKAHKEEEEDAVQEGRKLRVASAGAKNRQEEEGDEPEEDDRPKKKKKKKKKGS